MANKLLGIVMVGGGLLMLAAAALWAGVDPKQVLGGLLILAAVVKIFDATRSQLLPASERNEKADILYQVWRMLPGDLEFNTDDRDRSD